MFEETLYTNDGREVVKVMTPPWQRKPELLFWGERIFIMRADGRYTEALGAFYIAANLIEKIGGLQEGEPTSRLPE